MTINIIERHITDELVKLPTLGRGAIPRQAQDEVKDPFAYSDQELGINPLRFYCHTTQTRVLQQEIPGDSPLDLSNYIRGILYGSGWDNPEIIKER